jgi:hypothetical protein
MKDFDHQSSKRSATIEVSYFSKKRLLKKQLYCVLKEINSQESCPI